GLDGQNIIIGSGKPTANNFLGDKKQSILANHENMDIVVDARTLKSRLLAYGCDSSWPSYWCELTLFDSRYDYSRFNSLLYHIPKSGPFGFTNYTKWNLFEKMFNENIYQERKDEVDKYGSFTINNDQLYISEDW